jgi:hypothetical protein
MKDKDEKIVTNYEKRLEQILEHGCFSDLVITTQDGREFLAHKVCPPSSPSLPFPPLPPLFLPFPSLLFSFSLLPSLLTTSPDLLLHPKRLFRKPRGRPKTF